MNEIYAVTLENPEDSSLKILGIFDSFESTKDYIKQLQKKHSYLICRFPINTPLSVGKKFKDTLRNFGYHYFGTTEETVAKTDDNGNMVSAFIETIQRWPDSEPQILKRKKIKLPEIVPKQK